MKRALYAVLIGGLSLVSCTGDDNLPETDNFEVPATYTFERGGNSTVSFDGQTTRLNMVEKILASFNDVQNATVESLSNKYSNTNDPFAEPALNTSGKSVKSKVAASKEYFSANSAESAAIKNDFESYISTQVTEVFPRWNELAAPGVAGQIPDGQSVRYVNSKGFEMNQLFAKGLIGALVTDQMLNNYLSPSVLDEGDNVLKNTNKVVQEGKNYTTMEHKWDEAYGYLYGHPSIPEANPNSALGSNGDQLLFKYVGRVENDPDFAGIADEIYEAFKTGRAAIVAGNYEVRNEQIAIIRENVSKIIGIRAVYYLQAGKKALAADKKGTAFHALSEGFGFIYSLRFTHDPLLGGPNLGKTEINVMLDQLMDGNGLWDVTAQELDAMSQFIADRFDFTLAQAAE